MAFNTPLRYPGGKGRLTNFFRLVFEQNKLMDGHYVEPYCGGGGIGISLLLLEYASSIHLNDVHRPVHAFWHSVLNQTDELCEMIEGCHVTMDEWDRQKAIQKRAKEVSLLELGFSTFFLNRTNRSGILWAGVIGGKQQNGPYKLDARFNKGDLISRIRRIAGYSDRIHLYNQDAEQFIRSEVSALPTKTLIYCDPPYYRKGGELYEHHYQHEDHVQFARTIEHIQDKKWIVSYDNTPEIRAIYEAHPAIVYGLHYSAQNRYQGSEIMFFGPGVRIPDVENPAKASAA
jgi:DNA adenine methylase